MSLINDVLRDLDERRERRADAGPSTLAGLRPAPRAPEGRRRTRGVFVVGLALAVFAALNAEAPRQPELPAVASAPPLDAAPTLSAALGPTRPLPETEPVAKPRPRRSAPARRPRVVRPEPEPLPEPAPVAVAIAEAPTCASLYPKALDQAGRGKTVAARERLGDCLALDPRHRHAREALASLLARDGRRPEAIGLLRSGRALHDEPDAFALLEARIRVEDQDVEGALDLLEALAGTPEADALRAALYQGEGRHLEAAQVYSALVVLDASRPAWWMGLAISYESLGDSRRAVGAYRHVEALGSLDDETRTWVGQRIHELTRQG